MNEDILAEINQVAAEAWDNDDVPCGTCLGCLERKAIASALARTANPDEWEAVTCILLTLSGVREGETIKRWVIIMRQNETNYVCSQVIVDVE